MAQSQPIGKNTFFSDEVDNNVHLHISKMTSIFGFSTDEDFKNFLRRGEMHAHLRALMKNMPNWPNYKNTGITMQRVLSKILTCESGANMFHGLTSGGAMQDLSANHLARKWGPIDWLAWAVYAMDGILRSPSALFGSRQHPHTVRQSRERIYRAILFVMEQRWDEARLQEGRVADEDLESMEDEAPGLPFDGFPSEEAFAAKVALDAMLGSANKANIYDLDTLYGRYLSLKSVEHRCINPGAPRVLTDNHEADILQILMRTHGITTLEQAREKFSAMSGETLAKLAHENRWDASDSDNKIDDLKQAEVNNARFQETLLSGQKIDQDVWGNTSYAAVTGRQGPLANDLEWDASGAYKWKHARENERVVPFSWQLQAVVAGINRFTGRRRDTIPAWGMLLADETGLGKTMTAICLISAVSTNHPPHLKHNTNEM